VRTLSKGIPAMNCLKEIVYDLGKAAGALELESVLS